jgi:hypothetical protein
MNYSEIVAKHTNTYIDSMRADIYREVIAKFSADHKIENPYLTNDEMDALKIVKTNNLPNNFAIPSMGLSIYGYYISSTYIPTKIVSSKPLDKRFIINEFAKVLYFINGYFSLEYPQETKYNSILVFQDKYYILGPYKSEDLRYQFYLMHPKNPTNILSRYFVEFCSNNTIDHNALPYLVRYDFFIQKRMGFVNKWMISEEDKVLLESIVQKRILIADLTKEANKRQLEFDEKSEGINNLRKIESELKHKVSSYNLEISNLEIQLRKFQNSNEEKIALHIEVEELSKSVKRKKILLGELNKELTELNKELTEKTEKQQFIEKSMESSQLHCERTNKLLNIRENDLINAKYELIDICDKLPINETIDIKKKLMAIL